MNEITKLKILTVNCVFEKGSTGRIIMDIATNLSSKCNFIFCYETGPASKGNNYRIASKNEQRFYYILARVLGLKYSTGFTSTYRLISFIKKQNPDIVHLHCPNVNTVNIPWLISFLKKQNIPTVITNHAEFYYTGNCPHAYDCLKFQTGCGNCNYVFDPYRRYLFDRTTHEWKLMKGAFENNKNVIMVAVSPWVQERMKLSPITNALNSYTIKNGINTDIFNFRGENARNKLGLPKDKKIVLQVTANFTDEKNDLKGGRYVIELAKRMKNTLFIVIGTVRIKNPENLSENIKILGNTDNQNLLAEYYSAADLTIITSKRETYGMACAESLSCGTKVVGFKAGGPESISMPDASEFVEYGNIDALEECIKKNADGIYDKKNLSDRAVNIYSSKTMADNYYEIYCRAVGGK